MSIHQVSSPSVSSPQSSTFETNNNHAIDNPTTQTQPAPESQRRRSTASRPRSQSKRGLSRHQCTLCDKSYDRADHLSRHLLSHDNTRPFQCSRCGKGFNRLDLLNRHVLGHIQHGPHNKAQAIRRPKERTTQACKSCVAAKAKCEDNKPCKRCRTKGINCVAPNASVPSKAQGPAASIYLHSPERSHSSSPSSSTELQEIQIHFRQTSPSIFAHGDPGFTMDKSASLGYEMLDDSAATVLSNSRTSDLQLEAYPSFFEQIMMPQTNGPILSQDLVVPPDVSNFVQDMDFSLDDFDFQFPEAFPTMDLFQDDFARRDEEGEMSSSPNSTLSLRADAFQLSPWEWIPPRNHDSLSKQKDISIIEGDVPRDEELQATMQRQCLSELLDVGISTFPSQNLLAKVMQAFYVQEAESLEGRVYSHTLTLPNTRPELLLAIIAAGAVTVNCDAIQKMGIAFQEIVRLAVAELFERDNSVTRDIQALQAYMLWLDVGLWSGYKRSMEIAGGFLQPLHTLLTKAKAFARGNHLAVEVNPDDSAEMLHLLWQDWRAKESLKRIGVQAFLHDSRASLALLRNPIISYAQMNVPLPRTRDLWMASDSQAWAGLLTSGTASILSHSPTLMDVFSNIEILDGLETKVDTYLCFLTALHATAAQVWDHRQQSASTHNTYSMSNEDIDLLSRAFQSHIYKTLTKLRSKCDTFGQGAPEVILLAEFLMMFLNVSLDDVQRFAGKDGERDAREIVPSIRKWYHEKQARRAIWHAGQVLRAAKSFRRGQLRGFHAVAVYFSALTLWVYALIIDDADLRSGNGTPTPSESIPGRTPWGRQVAHNSMNYGLTNTDEDTAAVVLDGFYVPEVRLFIMFNQGQPGLTATQSNRHNSASENPSFCSLRRTKSVMVNAAAILQANYSQKLDSPPLIVRTLVDLMKKLAELSGKEPEATRPGSLVAYNS